MTNNIGIAVTDEEILATFSVMRQLRPHIQENAYVALVRKLEAEVRFQIAALRLNGEVTAVAGFRLCHSLGWGRYLYIDDLVTNDKARSTGAGKAMVEWLADFARNQACAEVRLDSAVNRYGAHRFYLRERFDIVCHHFRLEV